MHVSTPFCWISYLLSCSSFLKFVHFSSKRIHLSTITKRLGLLHVQAEKKKRQAQLQEANKKKMIKRVERKMAAVARDRAWAQRLAELQRLEEEKKKSME